LSGIFFEYLNISSISKVIKRRNKNRKKADKKASLKSAKFVNSNLQQNENQMKHLNEQQRYTIYRMRKDHKTQQEIAEYVGVSQVSISKELSRNKNSLEHYSPKDAQMFADMRKERFRNNRIFTSKMEEFIREKLQKYQWSPEQIKGYADANGLAMVSIEWIYHFIRKDKQQGGNLYKSCRHRLKHRKRYVGAGVAHIPDRVSIHKRPPEIEERNEFGHWEMDLIQNNNDFIVTLVERKTRYLLMDKLPNGKQADGVSAMVVKLLKPYKNFVTSITTDNGGEFAEHKIISKKLKATVFFTDPYSSWQKGTVENTNKLIRQYIPKKTSIKNLNFNDIIKFQNKINNRPRKILHFCTPSSIFYNFAC
jgi:transposase, IS30 family